ncbi:hypothetical protein Sjap_022695 [Stephania japonica]|uniref:Uncharacterized protein n=1 Tax=Stephania japonica TaxID=461633 RepID=A0AAP0HQ40_9MAGN
MERILNPYEKESMRMAMLKHEETFKEQVLELHRLYKIQKMLMKNMTGRAPNRWNSENEISLTAANYINREQQMMIQRNLDLECPVEDYAMDESRDRGMEIEDESDVVLTLGPSRFRRRKKEETPPNFDNGPCFSSSSAESSFIQRTSSSFHHRKGRREEFKGHEWEFTQVPNIQPSFQTGKMNSFGVDQQLRKENLNRPPWLFQVLSLNIS